MKKIIIFYYALLIIFLLASCKDETPSKSTPLENMTLKCRDRRDIGEYYEIFIIHNNSFEYTTNYGGIGNSIIERKNINSKNSIIHIEFIRNEKNVENMPNIKIDSKWDINRYTGNFYSHTIYYRKDGTKDEDNSSGECIKEEITKKF